MTDTAPAAVEAAARRGVGLWPAAAFLLGGGLLALLLLHPGIDEAWENHPAHFWLVLGAAALSVGLGYAVGVAARRRRDARLFLVSLAFISAAAFLGLHALATPGVLLGKNAGFELATPFGLLVAGALAAASGLPLRPMAAERVLRWARALIAALAVVLGGWAAVSLSEIAPLAGELGAEELNGWQISLAAVGVVLYAAAAIGYFRLYRRRRAAFLLGVAARTAPAFQAAAWEIAASRPEWPRFRAAVNSGEVLAGLVGGETGHRKHGVVGDTVNLAARLEAAAPVGKVVLGAETAAALPPGAVLERLPALQVKGKEEPVEAYVLHSL